MIMEEEEEAARTCTMEGYKEGDKSESELESEWEWKSSEKVRERLWGLQEAVEYLPGAFLWRRIEVSRAMQEIEFDEDDEQLRKKIETLNCHLNARIHWLDMVQNDPFTASTGWDLDRFWRFRAAIGVFGIGGKPLDVKREFMSRGLIPTAWNYMTKRWDEDEDADVTLEEFTRNFNLYIRIEQNSRKKILKAMRRKLQHRLQESTPLRVTVLKKLASRHGGGIGNGLDPPKNKNKKKSNPNPDDDDDDEEEEEEDDVVIEDHTPPRKSKRSKKHNAIPLPMSKLKPTTT